MTKTKFFSLRLPFGMYVHYARGRKVGVSKPAYDKGLVHYNHRRKLTGKMIRSFFGEPNHYDLQGHCTGYSRPGGLLKVLHYNRDGACIGYSYSLFGILFLHRIERQVFAELFAEQARIKWI